MYVHSFLKEYSKEELDNVLRGFRTAIKDSFWHPGPACQPVAGYNAVCAWHADGPVAPVISSDFTPVTAGQWLVFRGAGVIPYVETAAGVHAALMVANNSYKTFNAFLSSDLVFDSGVSYIGDAGKAQIAATLVCYWQCANCLAREKFPKTGACPMSHVMESQAARNTPRWIPLRTVIGVKGPEAVAEAAFSLLSRLPQKDFCSPDMPAKAAKAERLARTIADMVVRPWCESAIKNPARDNDVAIWHAGDYGFMGQLGGMDPTTLKNLVRRGGMTFKMFWNSLVNVNLDEGLPTLKFVAQLINDYVNAEAVDDGED